MTTYTFNGTEQEKKIYCGREYEYNLTTNTQYNYIYVGDMPIALYVQGDTNAMYTLHTNYIGSIEKISDKNGNVVDSMSYTPFGQRRMFSDWSKTDTATHLIDRGFTGQQHLDEFALINFNGRMYDPVLAHFLSPDPYIQAPENPLNHNRYSYCLFSPLQYVDPSGEVMIDIYDGYRSIDGHYKWFEDIHSESFYDEKGILWTKVTDNLEDWNEAMTIRNAVIQGLSKISRESFSNILKDVQLFNGDNPLFTKEALLNNAEKYIAEWENQFNSATNEYDAFKSPEILNTGYALKYYLKKGDDNNAIGIIKSNFVAHVYEAAIETIERKIWKANATQDPLFDMHYNNAKNLLNNINKVHKTTSNYTFPVYFKTGGMR